MYIKISLLLNIEDRQSKGYKRNHFKMEGIENVVNGRTVNLALDLVWIVIMNYKGKNPVSGYRWS